MDPWVGKAHGIEEAEVAVDHLARLVEEVDASSLVAVGAVQVDTGRTAVDHPHCLVAAVVEIVLADVAPNAEVVPSYDDLDLVYWVRASVVAAVACRVVTEDEKTSTLVAGEAVVCSTRQIRQMAVEERGVEADDPWVTVSRVVVAVVPPFRGALRDVADDVDVPYSRLASTSERAVARPRTIDVDGLLGSMDSVLPGDALQRFRDVRPSRRV